MTTNIRKYLLPVTMLLLLLPGAGARADNPTDLTPPPEVTTSFTATDVNALIERFGPIMIHHPEEDYKMDDPTKFLDTPNTILRRAMVDEPIDIAAWRDGSYIKSSADKTITSSTIGKDCDDILPFGTTVGNTEVCYIVVDDARKAGDPSRVVPLIEVHQQGNSLYLRFWFFYPFNGPGKALVVNAPVQMSEIGRHYGDWEHVTLRIQQASNGNYVIGGIFLSRHSDTPWYYSLGAFSFENEHPIVYIAKNTHAQYPGHGKVTATDNTDYVYESRIVGAVKIVDSIRSGGTRVNTYDPQGRVILLSNVSGLEANPPGWYQFTKRWGQYIGNSSVVPFVENEVEIGPEGPVEHGWDQIHFASFPGSIAFGAVNPTYPGSNNGNLEKVHVFALAYDNNSGKCCNLKLNYHNGSSWSDWKDLLSDVRAVSAVTVNHETHVFALGNNNQIYHNAFADGASIDPWDTTFSLSGLTNLPGMNNRTSGGARWISAAYSIDRSLGKEKLHLFAVENSKGGLFHFSWDSSPLGQWELFQSNNYSPAPTDLTIMKSAHTENGLCVFFQRADIEGTPVNIVWRKMEHDRIWGAWASIPQSEANSVDGRRLGKIKSFAVSGTPDGKSLNVMATRKDGQVHKIAYREGSGWESAWDTNFNLSPSGMTSVSMVTGRVEVFAASGSENIWWSVMDKGQWSTWTVNTFQPLADRAQSAYGVLFNKELNRDALFLFVVTGGGNMALRRRDHRGWYSWDNMLFDGSSALVPR